MGRHIVKAALKNSHEVTVFHRGNHAAGDLGDVEEILGDRNFDLERFENRSWDVVIDMCGYLPQWVKTSAAALANSVENYVFISSVSAYGDFSKPDFNEDTSLARLTPEQVARFSKIDPTGDFVASDLGDLYGALKTLCEEEVLCAFPQNNLIIRPGFIVGQSDFTDRFTYWVMRVAKGGEVLAPGKPDSPVQFIDAKDLSEWIVKMIESGETGTYNAVNKPFALTFETMLNEIKTASASDARFTWVSEEFLKENDVSAGSDMPLYAPESYGHLETANVDKAISKGLLIRPLKETILDTLNWRRTVGEEMRAGLTHKREKALIKKWHEQSSV